MKRIFKVVALVVLLSVCCGFMPNTVRAEESTRTERVANHAGAKFVVQYDAELDVSGTEEELLARFLHYEGGTYEEKQLIAEVIYRKCISEYYPDTVKEVLLQKGEYNIRPEIWNEIIPAQYEINIAKNALDPNLKKHGVYNCYNKRGFVQPNRYNDIYETEHYVFWYTTPANMDDLTCKNMYGQKFELEDPGKYMYLNLPDDELLARYIAYEGGTVEEKTLMAKIVVYAMIMPDNPDDLREILTRKGAFMLIPAYWNRSTITYDEEDLNIAREALTECEPTEYRRYIPRVGMEVVFRNNNIPNDAFQTENYVFLR